ncbi:hypothetical protein ACFQ3C_13085 [Seohaeicola saemankumensis]|uniref:Uncharacterized protein n=1 Tax=Seohaeicola saemankumensis TaxID=481181 RepID=A0ABW3TGI7_9RHOB
MQNEWLLDVISDLKTFAVANGMALLARQLDQARDVALIEMASNRLEAPKALRMDENRTGADT